ncbi:6031_t:CDS:2 [Ambispora leptoticha]|uniref:6031_t:CDS:1 n=1 Tax=Ambispora leptoticha TaxID=144679 RepID=A0A9N9FFT3_9GLOM|nr:6031_t:CDS:2 [Ambispora leptoticha]
MVRYKLWYWGYWESYNTGTCSKPNLEEKTEDGGLVKNVKMVSAIKSEDDRAVRVGGVRKEELNFEYLSYR